MEKIEKYWVTSTMATGQVDVADGVIVAAPNVWKKFIGFKLNALIYWLAKCNGRCQKLRIGEDGEK